MKKELWKLKTSLYVDEDDNDSICNFKWNDNYKLFKKKGQIAERKEYTEALQEEYPDRSDCDFKSIYIFRDGSYLLSQEEFSDDFESVN